MLELLFLKYISDSFESRRVKLKEELEKDGIQGQHLESLLESRDVQEERACQLFHDHLC